MSLVSPLPGAYAVVTLDPRISLKLVEVSDDPIVEEECRKMVCGKYIACITKPSHVFDLLRKQCMFDLDFVVQGLLPDDPATFYHHSMSVPIAPNTSHPTGRRTIQAYPPLPWNDCYHTHPFHLKGRCAIGTSRDYPESCLTVSEAELLACFLENDDNHVYFQEEARDAGNPISVSPVPDLSPHLQLLIRMANKRPPITRPWWQKIIEHQMTSIDTALGEAKAPDSDTDVNTNTTHTASTTLDTNNDTASTPDANTASDSGSGLHTDTTSDTSVAPDADTGVAQTACAEELDLAELLYMQFSPPSKELLPFVRFTYDLSSFESPPHPSGFLREVEELKKIYQGHLDRRRAERIARVDEALANDVAPVDEASATDDAHVAEPEATDDALSAESQAHDLRVESQPRTKLRTFRRFTRRYINLALDQTRSLVPARMRQKVPRFHTPVCLKAMIRFLATVPRRFRPSAD